VTTRARRILFVAWVLILLLPTPASAVGDWDPNDVESPLDLRWIGAVYTRSGDIALTLSFYDPVPNRRFPRRDGEWNRGVWVRRVPWDPCCGEFGFIFRTTTGGLRFTWDEMQPTIPQIVPVERISSSILRVRFSPPHPGGYRLRAISVWPRDGSSVRDRTDVVDLGAQPGEG
jgi:hypothetical protein